MMCSPSRDGRELLVARGVVNTGREKIRTGFGLAHGLRTHTCTPGVYPDENLWIREHERSTVSSVLQVSGLAVP